MKRWVVATIGATLVIIERVLIGFETLSEKQTCLIDKIIIERVLIGFETEDVKKWA